MTPISDDDLRARLADREDNYTERKPDGVKPEEIRQTVCAFSNSLTAGATAVLFIGVHDRTGAVIGVDNPDALQKRVQEAIDRCYPLITNYAMRALGVDGKIVVAVKIGASENRPHFTGPAYVRIGSQSIAASEQQFNELVASRNDKVARILEMRDMPISVRGIQQRLVLPLQSPARYDAPRLGASSGVTNEIVECIVEACDVHVLRLSVLSSGRRVSKPMELVQISYDEERYRPLLIIRSDR